MGAMATLFGWGDRGEPTARAVAPTEIQDTRWRGASRALRSMSNWLAAIGSAISDLSGSEQRTLRARSRDAMRNQLLARAALTRCRTNIVGTGLMCRPSVDHEALGISADEGERLNAQLRAEFERWAEDPTECDQEATLDFYGLQALALLSAMASGDLFVLTPQELRAGGVTELKLQLIEADRISNPREAPNTSELVDGIRIQNGMPLGCWVRNGHPGDQLGTSLIPSWQYYPYFGDATGRRRVLHVWNDKERPGQVRGAPYLAPILEPLKQLERYGNAELTAAVVSAMVTVFIERDANLADDNGETIGPLGAPDERNAVALGAGAIVDLAPGEKATTPNTARPNVNFDPFFVAVVKQIGAAIELPLDELLLHYSSSYSAARAAMLQAWRMYTLRRWGLTQQFCQPVYGLAIDEGVAAGRLDLPGYSDPMRRRAYTRSLWIGPARGAMDELKEIKAARERIDGGVSNEAIETAAMMGEDWNAVYAQRAREIARRKAEGTWAQPKAYVPEPRELDPEDDDGDSVKPPRKPREQTA
jgi:lambda family phage portal protein